MSKTTMELVKEKELCYGCGACATLCPKNAITMRADEEGFLYPSISKEHCISCEKCIKNCPAHAIDNDKGPFHIYAVKHASDDVRMSSASGGAFTLIAQWVERKHGIIYGVGFDSNFCAIHRRAETEAEWKEFRFSKYMQSNLGDTFNRIKQDLTLDKWVLFTGTPCQVDGLYHALEGVNIEKLVTCDIICHGTPTPKIWRDYLSYIEKKSRKQTGSVNFRDKRKAGWHGSTLTIRDKRNKVILRGTKSENPYFQLFLNGIILRPSCHVCKYASFSRTADITLGDYWGVETCFPDCDDDKGISLFMCNTSKAEQIWQDVQIDTMYFEVSKEQCVQPNLVGPSKKGNNRDLFWDTYYKHGFEGALNSTLFWNKKKSERFYRLKILPNKILRWLLGEKQYKKLKEKWGKGK